MINTRFYDVLVVGHPADRRKWKELVYMGSRPLAALASLALTILGVVFLLPPECAFACSCGGLPAGSQKETVGLALSDSDAVFSGGVVGVDKGSQISNVTLRVDEVWKGPQRETVQVSTPSYGAACGYPFEEGREYLVYAYGKEGLVVDSCNGTQRFAEAQADLRVLGAGKEPTGGEVLSDTSGSVSAGAMVGLAGLALAASFLVVSRLVRTGRT